MADTAYERYKKDTRKDNLKDYTDFQKAMLNALDQMTEPKKPVKWFFGKDKGDVGALTLATTLSPNLNYNPGFKNLKIKKERLSNLSMLILINGLENTQVKMKKIIYQDSMSSLKAWKQVSGN